MKFIAATIAVASPFLAMLLVPVDDPLARHGLMYEWFYGIPANVLGATTLQHGSALFAATEVFILQYAALFTTLVGVVALLKWTFSSPRSVVTGHILDARGGYSTRLWTLGRDVPREAVELLGEQGNIFVMVVTQADGPKQVILKREIWNEAKKELDRIDAEAEASMQRVMAEIDKLR